MTDVRSSPPVHAVVRRCRAECRSVTSHGTPRRPRVRTWIIWIVLLGAASAGWTALHHHGASVHSDAVVATAPVAQPTPEQVVLGDELGCQSALQENSLGETPGVTRWDCVDSNGLSMFIYLFDTAGTEEVWASVEAQSGLVVGAGWAVRAESSVTEAKAIDLGGTID